MRDTSALRRKLCALACLPALAAACTDPPQPQPAAATSPGRANSKASRTNPKPKSKPAGKKTDQDESKADSKGPRINEAPPPPPLPTDPDELRRMPIDGDPPFIDGYTPEEDPCPSGNWCGPADAAQAIAPKAGEIKEEMGCPSRVIGSHDPSPIKGPTYAGLSAKNSMQGALNQHGTELARAEGADDTCCYHWFEYCSGRPLVDGDEVCTANPTPRTDWADLSCPASSPIAEALGEAWLEDAAAEHASVAAFSRVVQELMAVGAPPQLLEDTLAAATDEVRHARACYGMASRFTPRVMGPAPLQAVRCRTPTLSQVAVDALVEGCVGETTAALVAERGAAVASDALAQEMLGRIAEDEARHAALAWRTVRWALEQGGAEVAGSLRQALASLPLPASAATPSHPHWNRFGRLTAAQLDAAALDARREIVAPMLEGLLAGAREASDGRPKTAVARA